MLLLNSHIVKAKARSLGFVACGLAPALPLPAVVRERFGQWLAQGYQAQMHYLERHSALRLGQQPIEPGMHTVVSVALPYRPAQPVPGLSLYAQGEDYHRVMRHLLLELMHQIGATGRACVDTAPVLEKYWAWRCGLGWPGRHTQIVVPGVGSAVFLGELFLHQRASHHDHPMAQRCGHCRRCLDACPAQALGSQGLDARRCLSYLTIEHRGPLPPATQLHHTFYGCDRCLLACPHSAHTHPAPSCFEPSAQLRAMRPADWLTLTPEQFRTLFAHSAVRRAGYEGLCRNIAATLR